MEMTAQISRERMEAMTMGEVRSLIRSVGGGWDKAEKKVDLIDRYYLLASTVQPQDKKEPIKVTYDPKEIVWNKIEDVQHELKPLIDRGLKVNFTEDNTVWNLYFDTGRFVQEKTAQGTFARPIIKTESGNMQVPLRVIRERAQQLMNALQLDNVTG